MQMVGFRGRKPKHVVAEVIENMKLRITQLSKPLDHRPTFPLDSNRAYRLVFHVNDRPHPRQYIRRRHDNFCVHSVSVDLKQSRIRDPGVRGPNTGKAAKLNRLRPLWMPLTLNVMEAVPCLVAIQPAVWTSPVPT